MKKVVCDFVVWFVCFERNIVLLLLLLLHRQ